MANRSAKRERRRFVLHAPCHRVVENGKCSLGCTQERRVCNFFARGNCKHGDRCRIPHDGGVRVGRRARSRSPLPPPPAPPLLPQPIRVPTDNTIWADLRLFNIRDPSQLTEYTLVGIYGGLMANFVDCRSTNVEGNEIANVIRAFHRLLSFVRQQTHNPGATTPLVQ